MNLDYFALLMGLVGSLHCAGMCGPILLSLPFEKENIFVNLAKQLLYHTGRIFVYIWLAVFAYSLGSTFSLFTDQKILSLSIGGIMIAISLLSIAGIRINLLSRVQNKIVIWMSKQFGSFYKSKFFPFVAGMLNGVIPCGMVYIALGIVLNAGTPTDAVRFMLFFGIGTAPLLILIALGATYIKKNIGFNVHSIIPYAGIFMGILFVFRALQLDIPFVSPIILEAMNNFCSTS